MGDTDNTGAGSQEPPHRESENPAPGETRLNGKVYADPVFYYSRERRLERASPAVRAMNDGKPIRPGVSRTLFATKAHALIFATIIILCAMFGFASRITEREKGLKLGGNTVALLMFREDGELVLGIAKNAPKSGGAYTGPVDIAVSPAMPEPKEGEPPEVPEVFASRIFFTPAEAETYRIELPFAGENDFFALLRTDDEQKTMRIKTGEAAEK